MKKFAVLLFVMICIFTLTGCDNNTVIVDEAGVTPSVVESDWGVTLSTEDVTATGLTLVCTQSGGAPTGELHTGSFYCIEVLKDGQWTALPYKTVNIAWTMEAWSIGKNDTVRWSVDWQWLYGNLPAGEYRIGKDITDFIAPGDYDSDMHYAYFEIK